MLARGRTSRRKAEMDAAEDFSVKLNTEDTKISESHTENALSDRSTACLFEASGPSVDFLSVLRVNFRKK